MRKDKHQAIELRKSGATYQEIEKLLIIPRSTLCTWFGNEIWSKDIKKLNTDKHINRSIEHLQKMNAGRHIALEKKYAAIEEEAIREFWVFKDDPLFMAGLMAYAGEGDKRNRHSLRFSNSEFYLHLVFISFSEKFLKVDRRKVKVWLLLYPDHEIEKNIGIWSEKLRINKENFYKSQIIKGKEKSKKLQYGVANSIISSTSLKKKMQKWLELCKLHFN